MHVRVIAFLLALLVAAGAASSPVLASPGVAGVVAGVADDGAPELEPAVVVTAVALAVPVRRELQHVVAPPGQLLGRLHGVSVFRPPR